MTEESITLVPAVMIDKHLFGRMTSRLTNEQIGAVMKALFACFFGTEGPELNEIEAIYYEELLEFAEKKAKNYLSQTYNSRHNNPRKKYKDNQSKTE